MAEQIVTLVSDSGNTGKKIRTLENTVGGNIIEQQVVSLADSAGALLEGTTQALPVKHGATASVTGNLTAAQASIAGTPAAGSTVTATTTNFSLAKVQITGTYSGTVVFDGSNDAAVNYSPLIAKRSDDSASETSSGALVNITRIWEVPVAGLTNLRVRCSVYVSGTIAVTVTPIAGGSTVPSVQGNVASGAADSGSPVKAGGVFNAFASLPALTAAQRGDVQLDPAGTLKTGSVPLGTAVSAGANVAAAANNQTLAAVAAKMNYLSGFAVSGLGATAAGSIAITTTGLAGNLSFVLPIPAGVTAGVTPLIVNFDPPLPASAVNVAIVVNVPSFGAGNTSASASAWGFTL